MWLQLRTLSDSFNRKSHSKRKMYVSFNETVKVMPVAVTLDPPKPFTKPLRAEPWVGDCDDGLVSPRASLDASEKRKTLHAPRIERPFPDRLPRSLSCVVKRDKIVLQR
jgi:hypothetical protein